MRITKAVVRRGVLALALGAAMAALPGCLIAGSAKQERTGKYVADTTFNQIEPGKTTAGWVLATLGEPDKKIAPSTRLPQPKLLLRRRGVGAPR